MFARILIGKTSEVFLCVGSYIFETVSIVGDDFCLLIIVNGAAQLTSFHIMGTL